MLVSFHLGSIREPGSPLFQGDEANAAGPVTQGCAAQSLSRLWVCRVSGFVASLASRIDAPGSAIYLFG